MTPDFETLRTMWRYHMGQAYWQANPMWPLGVYDRPGDRIAQYVVYGLSNLLIPLAGIVAGELIFGRIGGAAAPWLKLGIYALMVLVMVHGGVLLYAAARLARALRSGGDTDRCDPIRRRAMRRAYRWANKQGWVHEVGGRPVFDRRGAPLSAFSGADRRGPRQGHDAPYPKERKAAEPIVAE